jgi:hypothetical protein
MYPYHSLSKAQLIELVNLIESTLSNSIIESHTASKEYSKEVQSQLAFEVGHLNGYIRASLELINDYKNC